LQDASYTINWGDNTSQTVTATATTGPVTHPYSAAKAYTVSVTTQDQVGGVSAPATATVIVSTAAKDTIVLNDPKLAAGKPAGAVWVTWNGTTTTYQPTDQVLVTGRGGSDLFGVYFGALPVPVTVAGSGTDTLKAYGATNDYFQKTATQITWGKPPSEFLSYAGLQHESIYLGNGKAYIKDPGSTDTTIVGGPGDNTFEITNTAAAGVDLQGGPATNTYIIDLGSLAGPVAIQNSNAGATDSLVVNGEAGDNSITVAGNQVTEGARTITDSAPLANLTINGGSGNNQFTVSALTVPVQGITLAGGGGTNTYTVNAGTVNIVPGTGVNVLNVTGGTVASIKAPAGDTQPLVFAHSYSVLDNGTLSVPANGVLANDLSPNGQPLTAVLGSGPAHGTVGLNANGSFTYTPAANFVGSDSFTYEARGSDGTLSTAAPVTIQVTYHFSGFLAPLYAGMTYALGRTIPIKFQLTDANGAAINSLSAIASLQVVNPAGQAFNPASAGGVGLRYDPTANQFVFNWQTKGLTSGTYTIVLSLSDGTTKSLSLTLSSNGAFQLANGAISAYGAATSNQVLYGTLTVAVEDDTGAGIDPNEVSRISDAMAYLNVALGSFGVALTWAAAGTVPDVHIHFASSTPEGGAPDGVLGFTTADNAVYLVEGWDFYTGADATQVGAGQYDFQTLAEHELAHTVGLGESSDPGSVMYEYLAPGVARRTFTAANLTLINTDADRFMKAALNAPGGAAVPAGQPTSVAPSAEGGRNGLLAPAGGVVGWAPARIDPSPAPGVLAGAGGVAAWAPARIDPSPGPGGLPGLVGGGLRADMPADGGAGLLVGGAGEDVLVGGAGRDVLVGGFAAGAPGGAAQEAGGATGDTHGAAAEAGATSAGAAVAYALPSGAVDDYFLQAGSGEADMPSDPGVP
jgi:hypothetical protein